ncbi:aminotransferase class I/II-fold pyridoxal phosphate-dependent enzyme [Chlorobium phaeobacteroides]|uniref:8-amino-7-oxononanoate synthase n=1 Tax=Chlorobium phaeobacteroides (strain DSM 266 / SMG 266 / 2430) TaxID=290317 RepID=A1BCQ6_CHLPD|nr:8-amino-7-oxononanoate synthase [Chlorobium phaeobacteroides DSM 266]
MVQLSGSMMPIRESIERELLALRQKGRYRELPSVTQRSGNRIRIGGKLLLNLSSNDYLGLGDRREMLDRYLVTLREAGYAMTSSSSRLLTGNHPLYGELEQTLADLYGREAALVFNSGYHANTGILPALSTRHDLILCDRLNHASIIDGLMIAAAPYIRYRHGDYQHLEELLSDAAGRYRQLFIISESVFSMDGDLADLERLVALKKRYGAFLIIDEAHGVGVFGQKGLGLCEVAGMVEGIDMIVGTFGKAFASVGAYAVMDTLFREYLINTMRPLIFTTALPPAILGWSLAVVRQQAVMSDERNRLQALAARLRNALRERGLAVAGESQIVPVVAGGDRQAVLLAEKLAAAGILALPVRPPTVPENSARLRLSLRADLQWEDIESVPELLQGL